MLSVVKQTSTWTVKKVNAILRLMEATLEYMREEAPKIYSPELVDGFLTSSIAVLQILTKQKLQYAKQVRFI